MMLERAAIGPRRLVLGRTTLIFCAAFGKDDDMA
jgi:hypothetical protein